MTNMDTMDTKEMFSRQALTIPRGLTQNLRILVIGAGTTGSNVTSALSRMGVGTVSLYDADILSLENVVPSFGTLTSLGLAKPDAVAKKIKEELGFDNVEPHNRNWTGQRERADIVIIGTDSMASRRAIWEKRDRIEGWKLWIDARMGGDQASATCVKHDANQQILEKYEASINMQGAELMCGEKATVPICSFYLPGIVSILVMRFIRELSIPYKMWSKFLMEEMFFMVEN